MGSAEEGEVEAMEFPIEPEKSGAGTGPRKASGRWRRYSLRGLFALVTAAAIACGWVMYRVRELREQKAFIDELVGKGFEIGVEPIENAGFWRLVAGDAAVQMKAAWLRKKIANDQFRYPTAEDLKRLASCTSIQFLQLWGPHVTDEVLKSLTRLRRVQSLCLYRTAITDRGLSSIGSFGLLGHLEILASPKSEERAWSRGLSPDCFLRAGANPTIENLRVTNITLSDASVEAIVARFPRLVGLDLIDTNVTDRGLLALTRLTKLEAVEIEGAPEITDKGLLQVARISELPWKRFDVSRSGISHDGVKRYEAMKPPVPLYHDVYPPVILPRSEGWGD